MGNATWILKSRIERNDLFTHLLLKLSIIIRPVCLYLQCIVHTCVGNSNKNYLTRFINIAYFIVDLMASGNTKEKTCEIWTNRWVMLWWFSKGTIFLTLFKNNVLTRIIWFLYPVKLSNCYLYRKWWMTKILFEEYKWLTYIIIIELCWFFLLQCNICRNWSNSRKHNLIIDFHDSYVTVKHFRK